MLVLAPTNANACADGSADCRRESERLDALIRQNDPEVEKKADAFRRRIMGTHDEWLAAGSEVTIELDDEYAASVMNFLRRNGIATGLEYASDGTLIINSLGSSEDLPGPLLILIMTADDLKKPTPLSDTLQIAPAVATYIPSEGHTPLLLLRGAEPISKKWQGIIVLQFGCLAKGFSERVSKSAHKDGATIYEIVFMHEFKNRLLGKLGGKPYAKLLTKYVKGVKQKRDTFTIPNSGAYDPQLNEILGPALSDTERSSRYTQFKIHVMFRYLELRYAKQGESAIRTQKAKWLFSYFHELGAFII